MAGLHVNFSDQEAGSEALDFEALPSGKYYCRVTDIELKEVGQDSKNAGKNYWAIEFTVQDGEYENRKLWTNAMLFEGALYTLVQLLKATGHEDAIATGDIPDADEFLSKEVMLNVKKLRDTYRENRDGSDEPMWKNEVKGIKAYEGAKTEAPSKASKGKGTLLP